MSFVYHGHTLSAFFTVSSPHRHVPVVLKPAVDRIRALSRPYILNPPPAHPSQHGVTVGLFLGRKAQPVRSPPHTLYQHFRLPRFVVHTGQLYQLFLQRQAPTPRNFPLRLKLPLPKPGPYGDPNRVSKLRLEGSWRNPGATAYPYRVAESALVALLGLARARAPGRVVPHSGHKAVCGRPQGAKIK